MASSPPAALTSAPGLKPGGRTRARVTIWFAAAEGARAAIESIRAHAFRSFLTTLGIVIGVASVIAMVSVIQGLQYTIGQQFLGLGSNSVTVQSYTALADALQGKRSRLTQYDFDLIRFRVEGISSITPIMYVQNGQATVRYGSQTTTSQVLGTSYTYQDGRSVLLRARPVPIRQRQRHASARRSDRRASAPGPVVARRPGRRVHPDQRRVAQDHRPARGEGRDLGPEPGQPRNDPVQHDGEPAGRQRLSPISRSSSRSRTSAISTTCVRRSLACCARRTS